MSGLDNLIFHGQKLNEKVEEAQRRAIEGRYARDCVLRAFSPSTIDALHLDGSIKGSRLIGKVFKYAGVSVCFSAFFVSLGTRDVPRGLTILCVIMDGYDVTVKELHGINPRTATSDNDDRVCRWLASFLEVNA